jgi:hypothetical protein
LAASARNTEPPAPACTYVERLGGADTQPQELLVLASSIRTTTPVTKEGSMQRRILYQLTWLAAAMSLGHHLDHLIRGNAVGWPLTDQVNAFTASLVVYPIIATGLLLYHAGRVGPDFGRWCRAAAPSSSPPCTSAPPPSNHRS